MNLSPAISLLRSGRLVAFPTETVYGLGADATNSAAINRIYAVKGRPSTNPLIIHVADRHIAKRYAAAWPDIADTLADRFWPGPLTLVLPKSPLIVDEATAGQPTVGLRAPNHPLTLELLWQFDGPLAGPSANRSTRISPTTAQHVRDELGDAVDLILDGGPCSVGIESTVLDLTTPRPRILRPGGISRQAIEEVVGGVDLFTGSLNLSTPAPSPGQHETHYAPQTPTFRFASDQLPPFGPNDAVLWLRRVGVLAHHGIQMPSTSEAYAKILYQTLRHLDTMALDTIWVEFPPDEPQWLAVRDRLRRATRPYTSGSP